MKKKIIVLICFIVLIATTILILVLVNKKETKENTGTKENKQSEQKLNQDGIYSYLIKNDDETYSLILTADSSDYNTSVAKPYYVSNDYTNGFYDEKSQNYKIAGPVWYDNSINYTITKVIIKTKVYPTKTAFWFLNFNNLKSIDGLENIDFSKLVDTSGMFYGCSSLETLDLTSFDMKNIINTSNMFSGCNGLKTIYINRRKWDLSNVKYSDNMFYNTINLVGENNTKYDSNHIDKEYARIDGINSLGYLTSK